MRVEALMEMQKNTPAVSFDGYRRELEYEARGLDLDQRAKNETNLLAEKIRTQILFSYEAALKEHASPELAREEIKNAIESDMELAAPELKEELLNLSLESLENVHEGVSNSEVKLDKVQTSMKEKSSARREVLNKEDHVLGADPMVVRENTSKDSDKKDYATRAELMSSLLSDKESSRWVSSSNQTLRTVELVRSDLKISMQVKMEFLGGSIEAGPSIVFSREIVTNASIMAEGLNPVLRDFVIDGKRVNMFDRLKRDSSNRPIMKDGKEVARYISFHCDSELKFETDTRGAGGFKYFGMGADVVISKKFRNSVNLQSRRLALPYSVEGKVMTVKYISELCHNDFLKSKFSSNMTVQQSLNSLMKSVVSGLVFSHPQTTCIQDSQCKTWFTKENIASKRNKNVARCIEDQKDKFRTCQLRGQVGQRCLVYQDKKLVSSGFNEYTCDKGLKCVTVVAPEFGLGIQWFNAIGKCTR